MVTYVPLFIASRSTERPRGCLEKVLFEDPKTNLATAELTGYFAAKKGPTDTTDLFSGELLILSSELNYSKDN